MCNVFGKYSGYPNSRLIQYSNDRKSTGCQMARLSNGTNTCEKCPNNILIGPIMKKLLLYIFSNYQIWSDFNH